MSYPDSILEILGYMTPTVDATLLCSSRVGSDLGRKLNDINYMPQAGFNPLFAESAQSTE